MASMEDESSGQGRMTKQRLAPTVPFVGKRLAFPNDGEGAVLSLESKAPPMVTDALIARGPIVQSSHLVAEEQAGWYLSCPPAGAMAVAKSQSSDRFIVTRLPGNSAEAAPLDVPAVHKMTLPRGSFTATVVEWKVAVRRMARAGMVKLLVPQQSSWPSSVPGRLRQDLEPISHERVATALGVNGGLVAVLPRVERFCRLLLLPHELLRVQM